MTKIVEFRLGKGITRKVAGTENNFDKRYLELTVRLPAQCGDEDFHEALLRAEQIIDSQLEQPEAPHIPQFNPEDLMKHPWKGRKTGEGQYAKGSTAWGWDFKDKFNEETIKALEKGPITIDEYEFTLGDQLVSAKKKKN